MTYPAPSTAAHQRPRSTRSLVLAAVVLAIVFGAAGLALGRGTAPKHTNTGKTGSSSSSAGGTGNLSAPHGPKVVTNGIPTGYTHDAGGAATAAMNAVEAGGLARTGRVDGKQIVAQLAVSNPNAATLSGLEQSRVAGGGDYYEVPLFGQAGSASGDQTVVRVWSVEVSRLPAQQSGDNRPFGGSYRTYTVTLQWQSNDWKVADWKAVDGPNPGDPSTDPSAGGITPWPGGSYTFFVG